jgi:hypothetical protein
MLHIMTGKVRQFMPCEGAFESGSGGEVRPSVRTSGSSQVTLFGVEPPPVDQSPYPSWRGLR